MAGAIAPLGGGWAARPRAPMPTRNGAGAPPRPKAEGGSFERGPVLTDYEAPYHAQSVFTQDLAAFRPPLRSGDFGLTIRRDLTLARIQDIVRNDPHVSSALDKLVDLIVGPGLRWSSQPDGRALGIDDRKALRAFAKKAEAEFRLFSRDPRRFCDAERRMSLNGLFRLAARTWLTNAEATAVVTKCDDPAARYKTALLQIDPDRLCNPYGERDTTWRRMGVEFDETGTYPIGYHVREAHLGDYWAPERQMSWTSVERFTDWGRPVFIHAYEPLRESDTRGTSPLISLIGRLRMLGKFTDNELASATINALFAATIESDQPVEEVAERLDPAAKVKASNQNYAEWMLDYYTAYPVKLGGVRVPVMVPGSSMKFNANPRQTTAFPAFETAFLQTISSKLGLAYEQLKMDWSRTNYSSARAALNEVWRGVLSKSAAFIEQYVTPVLLAWADEAFDRGYLQAPKGAPEFWEMPGAYLAGRWIGPPRGYVDPVKEMEASALRIEGMVSTMRDECAEQGKDYEEVLDQLAQEEEDLKERGLDRLSLVAAVQSTRGPKPDSEEAVGPAGPGGDDKERASALAAEVVALRRALRLVRSEIGDLAEMLQGRAA
jgi:lambda family phage portal protein